MPKSFKIKKTYAKDQRHDACLRKIAFFNYEMENNIIMGRLRVVQAIFESMSDRGGSDIEDSKFEWRHYQSILKFIIQIQSRSVSNPPQ